MASPTLVIAPFNRVQTADQLHTTQPDASLLTNLNQGFANTDTLNAIATALNPGVAPPNYLTPQHYIFHHRMGNNVCAAPILLGMEDPNYQGTVGNDGPYPLRTNLEQVGQPELLLENKQPY